jgi:hypothetical protein
VGFVNKTKPVTEVNSLPCQCRGCIKIRLSFAVGFIQRLRVKKGQKGF